MESRYPFEGRERTKGQRIAGRNVRAFRETKDDRRVQPRASETPAQAHRTWRRRQSSQRRNDVALEVGIVEPDRRVGSVHSTDGERRTHQRHQKHQTCGHDPPFREGCSAYNAPEPFGGNTSLSSNAANRGSPRGGSKEPVGDGCRVVKTPCKNGVNRPHEGARTLALQEFLTRNSEPYAYLDVDRDASVQTKPRSGRRRSGSLALMRTAAPESRAWRGTN